MLRSSSSSVLNVSPSVLHSSTSMSRQAEYSTGYSAASITSALDPSLEYSKPSSANETGFTSNTARSMNLKSSKSDASMVRTLMSLNSLPGPSSESRIPSEVGNVIRIATAHGDKSQAAQFKSATHRAQTEGPRTLAQVEMHLSTMRFRASDISKNYAKLTSLSCLLTMQRQYNIGLQTLESENKMILSLVDKVIQGGSTQKVLSAIKQLKPIMQMMQAPLIDRMSFARFNESCLDTIKSEIQSICQKLSETSKQQVHASSFIPWNTDPLDTWVSDKASLVTEVIDQQFDAVGDEILEDVMALYNINQKLSRMVRQNPVCRLTLSHLSMQCLRLQGENDLLKQKMSEVISKIPDKMVRSISTPIFSDGGLFCQAA